MLAAEQGTLPTTAEVSGAGVERVAAGAELETVSVDAAASGGGVEVECVAEGGRLRVRVVTPGYDATMRVQFPKDVRVAGARYLVAEVRRSESGGFYRARGEIKRLL